MELERIEEIVLAADEKKRKRILALRSLLSIHLPKPHIRHIVHALVKGDHIHVMTPDFLRLIQLHGNRETFGILKWLIDEDPMDPKSRFYLTCLAMVGRSEAISDLSHYVQELAVPSCLFALKAITQIEDPKATIAMIEILNNVENSEVKFFSTLYLFDRGHRRNELALPLLAYIRVFRYETATLHDFSKFVAAISSLCRHHVADAVLILAMHLQSIDAFDKVHQMLLLKSLKPIIGEGDCLLSELERARLWLASQLPAPLGQREKEP